MRNDLFENSLLTTPQKTSCTLIIKGIVINLFFDEVTHISKFGYETIIHTTSREYSTKYSLQEILVRLPGKDFFKIHKSHIVSLKHITCIKQDKVQIKETVLPLSNYYKEEMIFHLSNQLNRSLKFYSPK